MIVLPWPDRALHPNARVHWRVRSDATKAARAAAYYAAIQEKWNRETWPATGRLHLWWDFYPPDRRWRDDDGLMSSMKAARDGIADAMCVNDRRFVSHPFVHDEVRKGGQVLVKVTLGPEHE